MFISTISPYPAPQLNKDIKYWAIANYNVILAMGLEHRNIYPCFSLEAMQTLVGKLIEDPVQTARRDLRELLPASLWPTAPVKVKKFAGGDIGMIFALQKLWHWSGVYTLNFIVGCMQAWHFIGAIGLFFLLRRLRLPLLPLLGGLFYAYNPVLTRAVVDYIPYAVVPTFTVLATLLASYALPRSPLKSLGGRLACVVVAGAILAIGSMARATSLYTIIPLTLALLTAVIVTKNWRELTLPACLILSLLGTRAVCDRFAWNEQRLSHNQQKMHVFWHPIWCGFGEFPNPYGFVWDDEVAAKRVESQVPGTVFASKEYEAVLKRDVVEQITHHPLWFTGLIFKRLGNFAGNWTESLPGGGRGYPLIAAALLLLSFVGFVYGVIVRRDWLALFVVLPFAFDIGIPLLIYSDYFYYNITSYLAAALMLAYSTAILVARVTDNSV